MSRTIQKPAYILHEQEIFKKKFTYLHGKTVGRLRKYFDVFAWLWLSKQRNLKCGLKDVLEVKRWFGSLWSTDLLSWRYVFTFQREIICGAIIYITKDLFILIKHSTPLLVGRWGYWASSLRKTPKFLVQFSSLTMHNFRRGKNWENGKLMLLL